MLHYVIGLLFLWVATLSCSEIFLFGDPLSSEKEPPHESEVPGKDTENKIVSCNLEEGSTEAVLPPKISIVAAIDTSAGMEQEIAMFQSSINGFYKTLTTSGTDPRIVLLSALKNDKQGVCVDAPLGSGTCPEDSNPPKYTHVAQSIGNRDAFKKIIAVYDQWKEAVHPDGLLAFLVITDDESDMDSALFKSTLAELNPPVTSFVFYSIAASAEKTQACEAIPEGLCCAVAVKEGAIYRDLAVSSEGLFEDLCLQNIDLSLNRIAKDLTEKVCIPPSVVFK